MRKKLQQGGGHIKAGKRVTLTAGAPSVLYQCCSWTCTSYLAQAGLSTGMRLGVLSHCGTKGHTSSSGAAFLGLLSLPVGVLRAREVTCCLLGPQKAKNHHFWVGPKIGSNNFWPAEGLQSLLRAGEAMYGLLKAKNCLSKTEGGVFELWPTEASSSYFRFLEATSNSICGPFRIHLWTI